MATLFISFIPGSMDLSRKPVIAMTLIDGKRRWLLPAPVEVNAPRWELLGEMLGAGIPEFRRRITAACGAEHADRVLGKEPVSESGVAA